MFALKRTTGINKIKLIFTGCLLGALFFPMMGVKVLVSLLVLINIMDMIHETIWLGK